MSGLLSQLSYQLSYKPVPFYYTQFFQKCKRKYIKYNLCRILKTGILLMNLYLV